MKRIQKNLILCVWAALIFGTQACNKKGQLSGDGKNSGGSSTCQITAITDTGVPGVLTFHYNSNGDPDSILSTNESSGYNSVWFRYDSLNRLIQSAYTSGGADRFIYWSKYYYDSTGRIVKDTSYSYGRIVGGLPFYPAGNHYTEYEYDALGRVTKTTVKNQDPYSGNYLPPLVTTYAYNLAGNLILSGVTYDNKQSLYSTHPVFQFMARDYSVNNPFTANSYNGDDFPVNYTTGLIFLNYYHNQVDNATVTWNCP
ncbi:MAG: hypothetical protein J7578_02300 [Chitinophagaceae bacterium]|nr:hypothetical protein [Chitinophagaceae bacterium]